MKNGITPPGNTLGQDAVTAELHKIMQQLGFKPQQELNQPFANWEDMQRWNEQRNQQKMLLAEALDQFTNTLNQTSSNLKVIHNHCEHAKTLTNQVPTHFMARSVVGVVAASMLVSLLLVAFG